MVNINHLMNADQIVCNMQLNDISLKDRCTVLVRGNTFRLTYWKFEFSSK